MVGDSDGMGWEQENGCVADVKMLWMVPIEQGEIRRTITKSGWKFKSVLTTDPNCHLEQSEDSLTDIGWEDGRTELRALCKCANFVISARCFGDVCRR
jgi:hypothetical protein